MYTFLNMDLSHLPESPGVYLIRNDETGECYVGSTRVILSRARQHFGLLRDNMNPCRLLQENYNQHGASVFMVSVIERCEVQEIIARELHWFNELKPALNMRTPCPFKRAKKAKLDHVLCIPMTRTMKEKIQQMAGADDLTLVGMSRVLIREAIEVHRPLAKAIVA